MITNMHFSTAAEGRLQLFMVYADFPAGIRAKHLRTRIGESAGNDCALSSEMWKLDSISPVGPIREMIIRSAAESDILVIAASFLDQPDRSLMEWLDSLVCWKAERLFPGLLVGILGDEEHEATESNWLVQELARFTGRTRMKLIWQSAHRDSLRDLRWLGTDFQKLLEWKRTLEV